MNLHTLYQKERERSVVPILIAASVSGIAQSALLGTITIAADTVSQKAVQVKFLIIFLAAFGVMIIGKRYAMKHAIILIERMVKKIRLRISDKIRHSDLLFLERLGKGDLYTRLAHDANFISQAAVTIVNAAQSVLTVVFCLIFVAMLSRAAFVITIISLGVGIARYLSHQKVILHELDQIRMREGTFFDTINQLLDGFKELKINRKKSDHYFKFFKVLADENEGLKIDVGKYFIVRLMFSQVMFYILLAVIVFLVPRFELLEDALIIRVTATILFIIGPMNIIAAAVPLFTRANIAIKNLYELEAQLDAAGTNHVVAQSSLITSITSFQQFSLGDVKFSYKNTEGDPMFTVGPINLTVQQGELVFLIGGNGSGKTTLLKLLTGLYYPDSGKIKVDDFTITPLRYQSYRELFSPIFSDFYLFKRLYGLDAIEYPQILKLLQLMKLEKKTEVVEGAFTNIDLSTGQRKRLAMVAALLDDRQVYVLDEWAADQDPIFREYFYNVLLQELQARGKTIIAVSHDDRYFHIPDRVLKMEYGQFVETPFNQIEHDRQAQRKGT
ncbi:MAG: cyclic peptide export ABC transporter [bacterium]|nr:cyclic peptide export ABC transporter [bacterium]